VVAPNNVPYDEIEKTERFRTYYYDELSLL
jgi:hypothetical protein